MENKVCIQWLFFQIGMFSQKLHVSPWVFPPRSMIFIMDWILHHSPQLKCWEYKCESWTIKKAECRRIDVFELCWRTLESPLDSKEMKSVNHKGNQPWTFFGKTDAEAPILWPPDAKSQLIQKDPDAGKDWKQKKGTTQDEMVGWHHQLNWRESEQTPGDGKRWGSLVCCSPWGDKESGVTEKLNNNNSYIEQESLYIWRWGGL